MLIYNWDEASRSLDVKFYREGRSYIGNWYVRYDEHDRQVENSLYNGEEVCNRVQVKYDDKGRIAKEYLLQNHSMSCRALTDMLNGMISCGGIGTGMDISQTKYKYDDFNHTLQVKRLFTKVFRWDTTYIAEREYYQYHNNGNRLAMNSYTFILPAQDTLEVVKKIYNENDLLNNEYRLVIKKDGTYHDTTKHLTNNTYNSLGLIIEHNVQQINEVSGYYDTATDVTLYTYDTSGNEVKTVNIKTNTVMNDTAFEVYINKYNDEKEKTEEALFFITRVSGYDDTTSMSIQLMEDSNSLYKTTQKNINNPYKTVEKNKLIPPQFDENNNAIKKYDGTTLFLTREIEYY